jgi:hypothetical protein
MVNAVPGQFISPSNVKLLVIVAPQEGTAKTCGIAKMNRKSRRETALTLELKIKLEFRLV